MLVINNMTLINRSPALLSTLAPEKGGDPLAGRIEKKCWPNSA